MNPGILDLLEERRNRTVDYNRACNALDEINMEILGRLIEAAKKTNDDRIVVSKNVTRIPIEYGTIEIYGTAVYFNRDGQQFRLDELTTNETIDLVDTLLVLYF